MTTMRIRHALSFAITLLLLAVVACGDQDEDVPVQEDTAAVTAEEVRDPARSADTATGEAEEGATGAEEAGEAMARTRAVYTVQVGAFVQPENARRLRQELEDEGYPVWTPGAELEGESFERVRVGAATTVAEARHLGQRLEERFGADFWVVPVPPGEELPSNLVNSTRQLLEGN